MLKQSDVYNKTNRAVHDPYIIVDKASCSLEQVNQSRSIRPN